MGLEWYECNLRWNVGNAEAESKRVKMTLKSFGTTEAFINGSYKMIPLDFHCSLCVHCATLHNLCETRTWNAHGHGATPSSLVHTVHQTIQSKRAGGISQCAGRCLSFCSQVTLLKLSMCQIVYVQTTMNTQNDRSELPCSNNLRHRPTCRLLHLKAGKLLFTTSGRDIFYRVY